MPEFVRSALVAAGALTLLPTAGLGLLTTLGFGTGGIIAGRLCKLTNMLTQRSEEIIEIFKTNLMFLS